MKYNNGIEKEQEFVYSLNNKKYGELSNNLRHMIKQIFGFLSDDEIIKSELIPHYQKADFSITVKGITKTISLKTGRTTVVHSEYFKTLIPFLKKMGVSEELTNFIQFYCHRDGTIDGTGDDDISYIDMKIKYKSEIDKFNSEMIKNKLLVKELIKRCLFNGTENNVIKADYVYFGTINFGSLVSEMQVMKHIERRKWAFMDNPHIGPLQFKSHYHGKQEDEHRQKQKYECVFWWANLGPDIEYISERYDG